MTDRITRLNKSDLASIEAYYQAEIAILGEPPSIDDITSEGQTVHRALSFALDFIAGSGRVVSLSIVEAVRAFGAPILATLFILLEADRVYHGVIMLGQHNEQALLIAITLTAMNAILPIYHLRNVTSQENLTRNHWTVRGYMMSFTRRLFGLPQTYSVDVYNNPALSIAESTITWATLFLAFFAVLGPMLTSYANTVWYSAIWLLVTQSSITQMLGLLAGLLLSVGGVFGVQSIAHELACRMLTDKPVRLVDALDARQADYQRRAQEIRKRITAEYQAAKIADLHRADLPKQHEATVMPESPLDISPSLLNQNGNHQG